tara:strand:+ start:374 stop:562 length:189 start_codon:yes stop_codon:yes gene_type:complete
MASDLLILTSLLTVGIVGWMLYQKIKYRPELFESSTLQTASFTLGVLAVFLIAVVGFFVVTM